MVDIKEINAEDTYGIRKEVLRKNMDLPFEFNGDFDKETFHLGVYDEGVLVSIASFMKAKHPNLHGEQYQLRGMATKENYQGKQFGKMLVQKSEAILKKKKVNIVWCNARVLAKDFYANLGFEIQGEVFDIPQIGGHYMMFKNLV